MTGIYFIKNKINNKIYIGSCKNFKKRIIAHKSCLKRNVHHCIKLQRAYNKYGEDVFDYLFIEETDSENSLEREQYWINLLNPDYNCAKLVGGHNKKATTEETKKKISESKNQFKKEVYKFDLNGNFIKKFDSLTNAAKSVGQTRVGHIVSCCKNKRSNAYGFRWSYTNNLIIKKLRYYIIEQYDLNGNFIKEWKGFCQIARFYDIPSHTVRSYILGEFNTKNKILKNYKWKKKEL